MTLALLSCLISSSLSILSLPSVAQELIQYSCSAHFAGLVPASLAFLRAPELHDVFVSNGTGTGVVCGLSTCSRRSLGPKCVPDGDLLTFITVSASRFLSFDNLWNVNVLLLPSGPLTMISIVLVATPMKTRTSISRRVCLCVSPSSGQSLNVSVFVVFPRAFCILDLHGSP